VKLRIFAVGHRPPAWASTAFEEYARRMPRELQIQLVEIKPARRTGDSAGEIRRARAEEASRILAAAPTDSVKIALDERGKTLTTANLAKRLAGWMEQGRDLSFIIGGADGLAEQLKHSADLLLSLSALTLPHALARVVLAEQLYRAVSLIRNHPYHRD
jgi:23S rRNA (pseudouridine1915-N3)-methyltransferase